MNTPSVRSLAAAAMLFLGGLAIGAAAGFGFARRSPAEIPPMLTGAGASFPYPLYRQWFAAYRDSTGVRINYYSVGSAGGIQALAQSEVDFGASDRPLTPDEISAMPCGQPIAIPTAVGAVAVAYHLSPAIAALSLDAATLAAIFDGTIRVWNDPRIQKLNQGVSFPAIPIRVIHRADGSGTTRVFVDFLASHVPSWARRSDNQSVRWPVGTAAIGNSGVASEIQVTPGSIGYVEVSYARQMRLPVAAIMNSSGAFVLPQAAGVREAAEDAFRNSSPDSIRSLINQPGRGSYPITSLTWLLMPPQSRDTARARRVVAFARWVLARDSAEIEALDFASLPRGVANHYDALLSRFAPAVCMPRPITPVTERLNSIP